MEMVEKYQILEPLSSMVELALLNFEKEDPKIIIKNHGINIDNPSNRYIPQSISRFIGGDSKEDIFILYSMIVNYIDWFIINNYNDKFEIYKNIALYAVSGLRRLQKTYRYGIVVLALQYYIVLIMKAISDIQTKRRKTERRRSRMKEGRGPEDDVEDENDDEEDDMDEEPEKNPPTDNESGFDSVMTGSDDDSSEEESVPVTFGDVGEYPEGMIQEAMPSYYDGYLTTDNNQLLTASSEDLIRNKSSKSIKSSESVKSSKSSKSHKSKKSTKGNKKIKKKLEDVQRSTDNIPNFMGDSMFMNENTIADTDSLGLWTLTMKDTFSIVDTTKIKEIWTSSDVDNMYQMLSDCFEEVNEYHFSPKCDAFVAAKINALMEVLKGKDATFSTIIKNSYGRAM